MRVVPLSELRRSYDFVVVGAGSAGCAAAAGIVKRFGKQVSVVLVEAGPSTNSVFVSCPLLAAGSVGLYPYARRWNWNLESVPQPFFLPVGRKAYVPRGCGLGGSSAINAMIYIRGHPDDYALWGSEFPGWSYDDVLPYFCGMERNVTFGSEAFHGRNGLLTVSSPSESLVNLPYNRSFFDACKEMGWPEVADFNSPESTTFGFGTYQHTIEHGRRVSSWDAHCKSLTNDSRAERFDVVTNCLASRLHVDKNGRATHIDLIGRSAAKGSLSLSSSTQLAVGGEVVVSLGAIHTPAFLLRSGIGSEDRVRDGAFGSPPVVKLDEVGSNLAEHFDVVMVCSTSDAPPSRSTSFHNAPFSLSQAVAYARKQEGTFANVVEGGAFIHSDVALNSLPLNALRAQRCKPNVQLHFLNVPLVNHARTLTTFDGYSIHVCDLYPRSRGSVSISSSDPAAPPLIDFRFLQDPRDRQTMRNACRIVLDLLHKPAFTSRYSGLQFVRPSATEVLSWKQLARDSDAENDLLDTICAQYGDNIYHPTGTCRMGSCVDASLRLIGTRNVRVADASVIPNSLGGNTNAACQMIGARAADFVATSHGEL